MTHRETLIAKYKEIHSEALAKAKLENNDPEALKQVTRDSADRALLKVLNSSFSIAACYAEKPEVVKASKLLGESTG